MSFRLRYRTVTVFEPPLQTVTVFRPTLPYRFMLFLQFFPHFQIQ
jgi:hypothetical protein